MFLNWLLLALTYLWAVFLVALGVYALTMRGHSSRPAAVIIKVLGALALFLLWDFWELLATTATLMRGLSSAIFDTATGKCYTAPAPKVRL